MEFLPDASLDIEDGARWYEEQQSGLGGAFRDEVLLSLRRIADGPSRCPVAFVGFRWAVVQRFPYGVFFRLHGEGAIVAAVYHNRRDPQALHERLEGGHDNE